jgi:hypothetical protein
VGVNRMLLRSRRRMKMPGLATHLLVLGTSLVGLAVPLSYSRLMQLVDSVGIAHLVGGGC